MSNSETKNQPVQEIRMGLIKAVVWANPTKSNGIMHNVTLSRIYRDTDGDWQETQSLGRNDLLLAAKVLDADRVPSRRLLRQHNDCRVRQMADE